MSERLNTGPLNGFQIVDEVSRAVPKIKEAGTVAVEFGVLVSVPLPLGSEHTGRFYPDLLELLRETNAVAGVEFHEGETIFTAAPRNGKPNGGLKEEPRISSNTTETWANADAVKKSKPIVEPQFQPPFWQ